MVRQGAVTKGRLRVHDPFELIRWLAMSQADPRKALAELVQNSLDAAATEIRVTRQRIKGRVCLRIWDDGEGVIPELDRSEALKYIATHIGHSRKRALTPQERLQLMTQGRYGIGLLGFWSLGETLELRSSVPGHRAHRLILHRDRPDYVIEPLRGRLPFDGRWTEVIIVDLHREASPVLACRRAADYLASELRGQLLARDVKLSVHDRIARGRSLKHVKVQPPPYLGEPLFGLGPLALPGYPPIQIELYLTGSGGKEIGSGGGVALYAAGSVVAETFDDLGVLGLDHRPWTDPQLTGMVDFAGLTVVPGTRRGVVPDRAAGDFVRALLELEPAINLQLEAFAARRAEELDQGIIRALQRAFRDFYRESPTYALLPLSRDDAGTPQGAPDANAGESSNAAPGESAAQPLETETDEPPQSWPEPEPEIFPPGPIQAVEILPARLRMTCGGRRTARARAVDASGREIEEDVRYLWRLEGDAGRLEADPDGAPRASVIAADLPGRGRLVAQAVAASGRAEASIPIEAIDRPEHRGTDEGIPEPELVDEPSASWRSRLRNGRWHVNSGHPEYRRIADRPALKLRYLSLLFAKEVVLRSRQDPHLEEALEQLVEVAAYGDERIASRGARKRKGR